MPTVEERLAGLEARQDTMNDLRALIVEMRDDMNRQFGQVERRFDQVERRFEQVDRRFEQVDRRFEALDHKVDAHLLWLGGIQVTLLLGVIGALVGAYYR